MPRNVRTSKLSHDVISRESGFSKPDEKLFSIRTEKFVEQTARKLGVTPRQAIISIFVDLLHICDWNNLDGSQYVNIAQGIVTEERLNGPSDDIPDPNSSIDI